MNTHRNNLVREGCWRFGDFLFMLAVGYILTQMAAAAVLIALVDTVTKLALFCVDERVWLRAKPGLEKTTDHQI